MELFSYLFTVFLFVAYPGVSFAVLARYSIISNSKKISLACAMGIATSDAISALCGMIGIDVLMKSHQKMFYIIRIFGSFYLLYLAIGMLLTSFKKHKEINLSKKNINSKKAFIDGFSFTFSNPSVIIAIAAIMSQYINNSMNLYLRLSMTILVPIISLMTYSSWALIFNVPTFRDILEKNKHILNRISALIIITLVVSDYKEIINCIQKLYI